MVERDLKKLLVKSKEIIIEETPLTIYGLTFPELTHFAGLMDNKNTEGALQHLLKTSLRKAITITEMDDSALDEFIKSLSSQVAITIIGAVKDLSGLETKESDLTKK